MAPRAIKSGGRRRKDKSAGQDGRARTATGVAARTARRDGGSLATFLDLTGWAHVVPLPEHVEQAFLVFDRLVSAASRVHHEHAETEDEALGRHDRSLIGGLHRLVWNAEPDKRALWMRELCTVIAEAAARYHASEEQRRAWEARDRESSPNTVPAHPDPAEAVRVVAVASVVQALERCADERGQLVDPQAELERLRAAVAEARQDPDRKLRTDGPSDESVDRALLRYANENVRLLKPLRHEVSRTAHVYRSGNRFLDVDPRVRVELERLRPSRSTSGRAASSPEAALGRLCVRFDLLGLRPADADQAEADERGGDASALRQLERRARDLIKAELQDL
jgi:hypothetical protein